MNPSEDFSSALETALRLLAKSPRSESQIRAALAAKGFESDLTERVIERLVSRRILDDERLALERVSKRVERGFGVERIQEELRKLGIQDQSIQAALPDASEWTVTTLRRRMEKRPETTRAAAYRFLASRGFTEDQIEQAVESVFGAEDRFAE